MAIAILFTFLVIILATAWWLYSGGMNAAPPPDDSWLDQGLGVPLPEKEIESSREALQTLKSNIEQKKQGPDAQQAHLKACQALMQRATKFLLQSWAAMKEMDKLHRMQRTGRMPAAGEWELAQEEFEDFKEERTEIIEIANWLRPGFPVGWGEGIFAEAHRALLNLRESMLKKGIEADDERMPTTGPLRFAPGARVVCNTGADPKTRQPMWKAGTVLSSYELPYRVCLDEGQRVNAPSDADRTIREVPPGDKGTPVGLELSLWKPYRFRPGDRVACNCGAQEGFRTATVLDRHIIKDHNDGKGKRLRAAYALRLDGGEQRVVLAPMDSDQLVRAITPEDEAANTKRNQAALQAKKKEGEAPAGVSVNEVD